MIDYSNILDILAENKTWHPRSSERYPSLNERTLELARANFGEKTLQLGKFCFGDLRLPYYSMGAINSTHLFGLDELLIFSFYKNSSRNYEKVADIGANIGLHSLVLAFLGKNVTCYEPDPETFKQLEKNIETNHHTNLIKPINAAVSTVTGELIFTRVLGNTTGSHLKGAKATPYGDLEEFVVEAKAFKKILTEVDLIKMDVEGHEAELICDTEISDWENVDAILEIGSEQNASSIYEHCTNQGINIFSQKMGWNRAEKLGDIPTSYKEGSAFISLSDRMPW